MNRKHSRFSAAKRIIHFALLLCNLILQTECVSLIDVHPKTGPLQGGTVLHITGTGFTPLDTICQLNIESLAVLSITDNIVYNDTYMICTMPAITDPYHITSIQSNNNEITLRVGSASETFDIILFDLETMVITDIIPNGGYTTDQTLVTVIGHGFVNTSLITCNFHGLSITIKCDFDNITQLTCLLPTYPNSDQVLMDIYLNGQPSSLVQTSSINITTLFTYFITPPVVTSITFSLSYTYLLMSFDREVEIGDEGQYNTTIEPHCWHVFDNMSLTMLGKQVSCSWLNTQQRHIVIDLPSDTEILPNTTISLNSTSIRTRYVSFSKHASGQVVIQSNPVLMLNPTAVLESPQYIPYCGNLSLYAGNSQYGGSVPLSFHWNISLDSIESSGGYESGEGTDVEDIVSNYIPNDFTHQSSIALPTHIFTTETTYVVQLTVQNFMGFTDSTSVSLVKHNYPAPIVIIKGGAVRSVSTTESNTIESTTDIPTDCLNMDSFSLQYIWEPHNTSLAQKGLKLDSSVLQIPPNTLADNSSYMFTVYVSVNSLASSNATVLLHTHSRSIKALIQGGTTVTYGIGDNIILDLSHSRGLTGLNNYNVLWRCYIYNSYNDCRNATNNVPVNIKPLVQTYIPAYTLKPGIYTLTGSIVYDDIMHTAIQTIHVLNDTVVAFAYIKWPYHYDSVLVHKKFVLNGLISSQYEAVVNWTCVPVTGYAYLPLKNLSLTPTDTNVISTTNISMLTEHNKVFVSSKNMDYSNPTSLAIPPGFLLHNNVYRFRLSINNTRYADIDIYTASKPSSGTVSVIPRKGSALVTKFTIYGEHWTDDIGTIPLYYRFGFSINYNSAIWLTSISESNSHTTVLPLPLHSDMTVNIVTEIYNSKGSLTVHSQPVILSIPTNVIDLADVYNDIHYKSVNEKKWNEGLSDLIVMLYSIDVAERYPNISGGVLSEAYISVFKQSSIELIVQLASDQLPLTRSSLLRILEILNLSVSNLQLSNDILTPVLNTLENTVNRFTTPDIVTQFSDRGLSVKEAQLVLEIYEKLISSSTYLQFNSNRVMNNEISKSFIRISQTVGIGLCQQLAVYEDSISISNYFGTIKAYYSILPWTFNATCSSENGNCPFQVPLTVTFGSNTFQSYVQSFCVKNNALTDCEGICVIATQLHSDFYWTGNPYANYIKSFPTAITLISKSKANTLLDSSTVLTLPLNIGISQSGTLNCVSWNNERWSSTDCHYTNKLPSQYVECSCKTTQEVAVIDYCPAGYYEKSCTEVCPQGLWGMECSSICECNQRGTCSAVDGSCDCIPGWTDNACQTKCDINFWGKWCSNECLCEYGSCHHVDGSCDCHPGWNGTFCNDSCPYGYYGKDCTDICSCRSSTECNKVNGTCICHAGYMGGTCHEICPEGYYGINCVTPCGCHWNGTYDCDHIDGTCNCTEFWNGTLCDELILMPEPLQIWWVAFPVLLVVAVVIIIVILVVFFIARSKRSKVIPVSDKETGSKESVDKDDDDDELEMTRANSLVLVHGGKTSSNNSIGQFKEPEKFGTKIRWQIIQLIPIERTVNQEDDSSVHSELKVPVDSDDYEEVVFLKGVYLETTATLKDLRNSFIDSNQLDPNHLYFQFLRSDTLGDIVPIDNEEETKPLSFDSKQRTIYVQAIDRNSAVLELCICGKFAELECTKCKSKGYCGETCQESDWLNHAMVCRIVSARRKEERRKKRKQKKLEKLKKSGYTPRPDLCRCGKVTEYECSECGLQGYCSVKCQEEDWEYHKLFCES